MTPNAYTQVYSLDEEHLSEMLNGCGYDLSEEEREIVEALLDRIKERKHGVMDVAF